LASRCFASAKSTTIHDHFATYLVGDLHHVIKLGISDLLLSRNAVFNGLAKLPQEAVSVHHPAKAIWQACPLIPAAINSAKVL